MNKSPTGDSLLTKMLNFGLIGTVRSLHAERPQGSPSLKFRWTATCDISKLNFQLWTSPSLQLPTVSPDNCLTAPTNDEGPPQNDWSVFIIYSPLQDLQTSTHSFWPSLTGTASLTNAHTSHLMHCIPATFRCFKNEYSINTYEFQLHIKR